MYQDFTEDSYVQCLRQAKQHWPFCFFSEAPLVGRAVLWRHDVDFSPQRALRLAQIEAEQGVRTTFFLHLHSKFYSLMEEEIRDIFLQVAALGHELGLHFEPAFYGNRLQTRLDLEKFLRLEASMLEALFDVSPRAFSFHNPDVGPWLSYDDDVIAGLHNAYSRTLKTFRYVSDSNGYWRFQRLHDVLVETSVEKLHVLTHPVWWQSEELSPKQRVLRCIEGRSRAVLKQYEDILVMNGRVNLG